jgi:hypothetical protein
MGVDPIRFRKNDAAPFQATHVFDNAIVKGRTRKPPIKNGHVTIRLQGIDAVAGDVNNEIQIMVLLTGRKPSSW